MARASSPLEQGALDRFRLFGGDLPDAHGSLLGRLRRFEFAALGRDLDEFHSGVLTLLTIVTLLRDVALLACWVVRRFTWQDVRRVSGSRRTALTLLTASAGLAFVGVVEGTRVPTSCIDR